ncbi:alkaline phosphatase [Escherichia coli]|uniref:alkaline phosphatase n=1 Tax=Escherichia coli TaxID=562 RepID=UPI00388D5213
MKTGKPDLIANALAASTASSTGVKTHNGALGVDIHEKRSPNDSEMAKLQVWRPW